MQDQDVQKRSQSKQKARNSNKTSIETKNRDTQFSQKPNLRLQIEEEKHRPTTRNLKELVGSKPHAQIKPQTVVFPQMIRQSPRLFENVNNTRVINVPGLTIMMNPQIQASPSKERMQQWSRERSYTKRKDEEAQIQKAKRSQSKDKAIKTPINDLKVNVFLRKTRDSVKHYKEKGQCPSIDRSNSRPKQEHRGLRTASPQNQHRRPFRQGKEEKVEKSKVQISPKPTFQTRSNLGLIKCKEEASSVQSKESKKAQSRNIKRSCERQIVTRNQVRESEEEAQNFSAKQFKGSAQKKAETQTKEPKEFKNGKKSCGGQSQKQSPNVQHSTQKIEVPKKNNKGQNTVKSLDEENFAGKKSTKMTLSSEMSTINDNDKAPNDEMILFRPVNIALSKTQYSMDFDVRTSDEKMRDLNSSTFEGRIAQEPQTRFTDAFNVLPFQDNTGPEFDKQEKPSNIVKVPSIKGPNSIKKRKNSIQKGETVKKKSVKKAKTTKNGTCSPQIEEQQSNEQLQIIPNPPLSFKSNEIQQQQEVIKQDPIVEHQEPEKMNDHDEKMNVDFPDFIEPFIDDQPENKLDQSVITISDNSDPSVQHLNDTQFFIEESKEINEPSRNCGQTETSCTMMQVSSIKLELFGLSITGHDISTLNGEQFLNDNIINFLLTMFYKCLPSQSLKESIKVLNTFQFASWLARYQEKNFSKLKSIIKKIKITPKTRYIIVPIHREQENHWALGFLCNINKDRDSSKSFRKQPCFFYLDSMIKITNRVRKTLDFAMRIFNNQSLGKSDSLDSEKQRFKCFSYRLNIPQQTNGYDCGIYLLEYAERFMLKPKQFLKNENIILYPEDDQLEKSMIKLSRLVQFSNEEKSFWQNTLILKDMLANDKVNLEQIKNLMELSGMKTEGISQTEEEKADVIMRDETKRYIWFDQKIMEGKRDILLQLIENINKIMKNPIQRFAEDLLCHEVVKYRDTRFNTCHSRAYKSDCFLYMQQQIQPQEDPQM